MRARLQHPLVLPDGIDQRASLCHRQRKRLFSVYVEPRLKRVDAGEHASMCGGLDENGVELLFIEHSAVTPVLVPLVALGHPLRRLVQPRGEAIGHRHNLSARHPFILQQPLAAPAQADEADLEPVIGAEHARRHNHGKRGGGSCLQKFASIHLGCILFRSFASGSL